MTEPPHPEPTDPVADDDELPDEVVQRLRALLRDEPIERDEVARERRLRAALDAAPAMAPVPVPRRSAAPWLTAAAVLVLVALGGVLLVAVARSGGGQDESADSAAAVTTVDADRADGTGTDESSAADGAGGAADEQLDATTIAPAAGAQEDAGISDLGEFPDAAALRAELGATADRVPSTTRSATTFDAAAAAISECIVARRADGTEVIAIATIGGAPVVVVRSPTGVELLAIPGCEPRPD